MIDRLLAQAQAEGVELLGPDGVLTALTSRLLNKAMDVELTDHLGYERGDSAGRGSGNSRNGTTSKTLLTDAGDIPWIAPMGPSPGTPRRDPNRPAEACWAVSKLSADPAK